MLIVLYVMILLIIACLFIWIFTKIAIHDVQIKCQKDITNYLSDHVDKLCAINDEALKLASRLIKENNKE